MSQAKDCYSGTTKKNITIQAQRSMVWSTVSQVTNLPWVKGVKKTIKRSSSGKDGAIREIFFEDANIVKEYIVGWKESEYFSYIATSGLPLRAYHATISTKSIKNTTQVTWQSYYNSMPMTKKEFLEFESFIGEFYASSLQRLKSTLEGH